MQRDVRSTPVPDSPNRDLLPDRFLTPADVATLLGLPIETLYQWRRKRTGPPAFRVGRHLRYDPAQLRHWVETLADGAA